MRFRFDDEALEVLIGDSDAQTENKFVGGACAWGCHAVGVGFCALLHAPAARNRCKGLRCCRREPMDVRHLCQLVRGH